MKRVFILLAIALGASSNAVSQKSRAHESAQKQYDEAMQLYDAMLYGSARSAFGKIATQWAEEDGIVVEESRYFEALAAKNLRNGDAVELMKRFVRQCAQSARRHDMLYHLGDYFLTDGNINDALRWFTKASPDKVTPELRNELLFKTGYCHFLKGKYTRAIAQFDRMRDGGGRYATAVKYYRAHIDYRQGNLNVALKAFVELEKDEGFSAVAPFYIAHISYLQGHYSDALRYAEPLSKGKNKKNIDMKRIVADSHFALEEYAKAVAAYEELMKSAKKINRADYYHYGMSLYKTASYTQAAQNLSRTTSETDELSQNAHYHLADCYLQLGDKKKARLAFEAASKSQFDKAIREDAHFNRLKLSYELNFSPFSEIITDFVAFINEYPNSDKIDEAYDYMGKAFVTTKNYRKALETMEKIQHKNLRIYTAMQRLSFYRGLELYSNQDFAEAIDFFDYSLKYGDYDPQLRARANYWKAESLYRTGKTNDAQKLYAKFIEMSGAAELREFAIAHYNLAYTHFNRRQYRQANNLFLKFTALDNTGNEKLLADAYNRLGDCMYVQRNFRVAIENYDKALATSSQVGDYSMLQKGICLGLTKDNEKKIAQLKTLIERYPKSAYCDNAYYEMARAHLALDQLKEAIYNYKVVKERYPKGSLAPKAMLQLGLLYYNNSEFENSMAFYKRVINEYPGTPDAAEALAGLRNVYMEQGDFDGFMAYTKTLGSFARVELHEQDSLMFTSAQRLYLKSDFAAAKPAFERYLGQFGDGRFATDANFYLADCNYQDGNAEAALSAFEYVANQPRSIYTEDALLRSSELKYTAGQYAEANETFVRLEAEAEVEINKIEAIIGQMRCQEKLGNTDQCIAGANKVIEMPQASPEILREANYLKAKSLVSLGRGTEAVPVLRQLAQNTKSKEGAEAKYVLAQEFYNQKNLGAAEAEIFDYIEVGTPHQYWLARSFVLLADIYHQKGEDFQAQQYLLSLTESYEANDDIADMVKERLAALETTDSEPATETEQSFDDEILGTSQLPDL